MIEAQIKEELRHHDQSLEERASAEPTHPTPKNGIICTICKDPYERWEELYYCPEHTTTTQHLDCGKGECTAIGCSNKLVSYIKPKTKEERTQGIRQNIEALAEGKESETQESEYEFYLNELMRRIKVTTGVLYKERKRMHGSYEIYSREKAACTFTVYSYVGAVQVVFGTPMNINGIMMNTLSIWPEKKFKFVWKKKSWPKVLRKETGNYIYKLEGRYLIGYDDEGGSSMYGTKRLTERDLFEKLKNEPHATQNVIETLEIVCRIPKSISRAQEHCREQQLQKLKLILTTEDK